ncbi:MAG: aminodeoxychorismate/anthranilate synthase component II [Mariniblastus sp.]|nr:aminodeoxychorismate/anthranilate synthase component II [Mariniblastus sp.]
MILIIDNYDSFTYNLVQRLGEIDRQIETRVIRNDKTSIDEIAGLQPSHLIISPGPCTPNEAGISVDVVRQFQARLPILGVCLGHQSIGAANGSEIVPAEKLMHGKTDQIQHLQRGIFQGIPNPMVATRYHSLVIKPDTLAPEFEMTAWAESPSGVPEIMAIQHRQYPVFGVQFHPESFLTETGTDLIQNFIQITP